MDINSRSNGLTFVSSWDDGADSDMRIAEMLDRYELQGTFFIPGRNREGRGVLDSTEVRRLSQKFEIGAHTSNHTYLNKSLTLSEITSEIVDGKKIVEDWIGQAVDGFCYPGGVYDNRVIREVIRAGFKYARTTENLRVDHCSCNWLVPTTIQLYPHKSTVYIRRVFRFPSLRKLTILPGLLMADRGLRRYQKLLHYAAKCGGIFHLWGHSWEIDRYDLWGDLDFIFREIRDLTPASIQLRELHFVSN